MRKVSALGLAGLVMLGLVGGCSSGPSRSNGASGGSFQGDGAQQQGSPPAAAPGQDKAGGGGGSAGNASARIVPDRALIRTADLSVTVDNVTGNANRAVLIAEAAGGQVYADQRNNGGAPDQSTADLTLKVPPNSLDSVLDQLGRLGHEESRHTTTEDVTEQVADVESRINSAKAALARLRSLYDRAGTIAELTTVETELAQRQADLESLQARQRALSQQTADATVNLHLRGKAAAAAADSAPTGFWSGLKRGWHTFAVSAGWLFTALGAMLPFLALAGLVGYGSWWLRRRRPHPTGATAIPAMPPADTA